MRKLTDKIEALRKLSFFIEGQQLDQALQAILADAREVERERKDLKVEMALQDADLARMGDDLQFYHIEKEHIVRQAKREAYEHARDICKQLNNHGTADCIQEAIDAIDSERK